uniref:Uncharacterized protein n=2 Tax=Proboscia inermis TaxID=420281 RepID=A0A7S0GIA5_9STRA|mmetsp:Transcript_44288/g.44816  ORF Transcript_44288/g.44816 Transcript_44288/m.44816 type:complete len:119 (+) Transcript_44288:207-563(+)
MTVLNVPISHSVVQTNHLNMWKRKAKGIDLLKHRLKSKTYRSTDLGRKLLGSAISIMPQASHDVLQSVTPLVIGAFCADNNIPVKFDSIVSLTPTPKTYRNIIANMATSVLQSHRVPS